MHWDKTMSLPKELLLEFDLAGAEWVVTAYLANDPNMISVATSGKSPHVATGALISGADEDLILAEHKLVGNQTDPDVIRELREQLDIPSHVFLPRVMSIRQAGKKSNHGLNYGMKYRRFALENEIPEADAKVIVDLYVKKAYPRLENYWADTIMELRENNRALRNCFGRKVTLMGEWGPDLWMAAYSFKPQSTVFDVCRIGMEAIYYSKSSTTRKAKLRAQIHDSLLYSYPTDDLSAMCRFIKDVTAGYMKVPITYGLHTFVLDVGCKVGPNWGDMHEIDVNMSEEDITKHIPSVLLGGSEQSATSRHLDLPSTYINPPQMLQTGA